MRTITLALVAMLIGAASAQSLTLYSGRGEALVAPLLEAFTSETGIRVDVRYGDTAQLAVLILEEGRASPADLFWGQDAGALGALSSEGRLQVLPAELLSRLPDIYDSEGGTWLATSGRARVLAYSPARTASDPAPTSIFDLTDPVYRGRVAWAPTNGSFQAFVTAMRVVHGEVTTRAWLEGMMANGVQAYANNTGLIEAIAAGEVDYALVNNYYLLRYLGTDPAYPVAQRFFDDGDVGNLVNVAGAGILDTSCDAAAALRFLEFLLSDRAQTYFTDVVFEYPVVPSVEPNPALERIDTLLEASPAVDLDTLQDLEGTLDLLREVGLL